VVYQIYPRSFRDSSGNGIGDLGGIIEKLDYIEDLGVDAIWLSPFFVSPMADFGYDVADYCDVDPLFGDLATFDRLLSAAHQRGIKVIIDYVPNHSSDQHPWFIESRRGRESLKRDWYIWRDAKPDNSPPNNWGSYFGGPGWTWDETSEQYYLHQFLPQQPELNWRNPEVRAAMMDVLRFWMERGVDGFRMDVVWLLLKDPELRDNPPDPDADPNLHPDDLFGRQLHIYNGDQDEVQEIIRDFRRLLDEYDERCAIGEIYLDLPRWIRYYGENGDGLHLPFNFRLIDESWDAGRIHRSVDELEAALPPFAWPNYVLGNHDRRRLASRFGVAQARAAALLLLTLRGTPTLYYGDELGMENVHIPPEALLDPPGLNLGAEQGRDGCRTPMQWDSSPQAGFSTVEPWLPLPADYRERNVAVQSADETSSLALYRRLLQIRRGSAALRWGDYRPLDLPGAEDCFVYLREVAGDRDSEGGRERRLIAINFSGAPRQLDISDLAGGRITLSTHLNRQGESVTAKLTLRPHEGVIIELI
jgi:alpha-glucosidase